MSHEILNNMISWKDETPWHGLGVKVDADATGEQMLIAAGMNWEVQQRKLAMLNLDGLLQTDPLNEYRAIVRSDNDSVFQLSTARYNIVQNQDIIEVFKNYCEAGHARMETVGALRGGAVVWALAKLNGGTSKTLAGGDELKGYLLMATSHDGTVRTIGKATQIRVVCWNTLRAALNGGATFSMKHSKEWTNKTAEEAKSALGMAVEEIQQVNELSEQLSKVPVDDKGRIELITRVCGPDVLISIAENKVEDSHSLVGRSVLDSVIMNSELRDVDETKLNRVGAAILESMYTSPGSDLESAKNTLWGAVNGITYYVDHERARTQDARLSAAWFGDGDRMKNTAMLQAAAMAGINVANNN